MNASDIITKRYVAVDLNDTVSKMIGKMRRAKMHQAVVFDGKKYKGLIDRKFLLSSRIDPSQMKVGNAVKKRSKSKTPFYVSRITPDASIPTVVEKMNTSSVHVLPVIQNEKVIGIIRALDVVNAIKDAFQGIKCEEIIPNQKLKSLRFDDEIGKLIELMNDDNITHVPIVDKMERITGIVSLSNFMEEFTLWNAFKRLKIHHHIGKSGKELSRGPGEKENMLKIPVEQVMSSEVVKITPSSSVKKAIQEMHENNVSSVVISQNGKPLGIITAKDILNTYVKIA